MTTFFLLGGIVDDFGNLTRACDLPHDIYMQRYAFFRGAA
jgi:hypothetical protein